MFDLLVWLKWLFVCALATEAASEIVVESKFLKPFHKIIRDIAYPADAPPPDTHKRRFFSWIDSLTSCGYCVSVWIAGFYAPLLPGYPSYHNLRWYWLIPTCIVIWSAYGMLIHRTSNWLHTSYELYKRGRVKTYDHTIRLEEPDLAE